jgi:hypothetical protein
MAQTQEEIAQLKEDYLRFFAEFPVQKAAADFIGRTPATIQDWQNADPKFLAAVQRAKAEWAKKAHRRVRPDNLLANLYDETKPPKQEIDTKVTMIEGQSADDLLAEARSLGLDTSAYEPLLTGSSTPGTEPQNPTEERA